MQSTNRNEGIIDGRVFVVDRYVAFMDNEEPHRTNAQKRLKFEV